MPPTWPSTEARSEQPTVGFPREEGLGAELNASSNARCNTGHPPVKRRHGKKFIRWRSDEGSLGSYSMGKVNVDCTFRLTESKWGTLGHSRPAGVVYIDLTFHQPERYRLSSATVQISLEEYEETEPSRKKWQWKGKEKAKQPEKEGAESDVPLSCLHVWKDDFGPKLLTGEPTIEEHKTEFVLVPEVNAGFAGAGGIGMRREYSAKRVGCWILKGNKICLPDSKRKMPGIVYRTIKWDLRENELASQSSEKSVVHAGFAFEHEMKPFYIKVEITGRLKGGWDNVRHAVFPPKLKGDQGTTLTLVDLNPRRQLPTDRLDWLARSLEEQMQTRNLVHVRKECQDGGSTERATGATDTMVEEEGRDALAGSASDTSGADTTGPPLPSHFATLAKATKKFAPSSPEHQTSLSVPSEDSTTFVASTASSIDSREAQDGPTSEDTKEYLGNSLVKINDQAVRLCDIWVLFCVWFYTTFICSWSLTVRIGKNGGIELGVPDDSAKEASIKDECKVRNQTQGPPTPPGSPPPFKPRNCI